MADNHNTGHRGRLKKRVMEYGIESLEDHEFLEMLLFYAIPRKNTNHIAHNLIDHFGSLKGVFEASVDSLKEFGLSERAAVWINSILYYSEIYKLLFTTSKNENDISARRFSELITEKLKSKTENDMLLILVDNVGTLVQSSMISVNKNDPLENIRLFCQVVSASKASNIILAVKRDRGKMITDKIYISDIELYSDALYVLGVNFLDCVVLLNDGLISYRDHNIAFRR